jgi:D-sedoheptulose 7-phosphate isomerase
MTDAASEGLHAYLRRSRDVIGATIEAIPESAMQGAVDACVAALRAGKPILTCGNGGSASDAIHIATELVGKFLRERRSLKAICLSESPGVLTAWSNDYEFATVFARQVEAHGEPGAALVGLSTSGNSRNVIAAFEKARELGMATVALTGEGGGKMAAVADHLLAVPSTSTPLIQQVHICLYHHLCAEIERALV